MYRFISLRKTDGGSSKLERLDLVIRALDVKLKHSEWFEIYAAGGQQIR